MKTSYLFVETFTLEVTVLEQAHADLFIPSLTYRYEQTAEIVLFDHSKYYSFTRVFSTKAAKYIGDG